ncbi:hypothetical protein B8W95_13430, partial [Staphylococcus pasteuri]
YTAQDIAKHVKQDASRMSADRKRSFARFVFDVTITDEQEPSGWKNHIAAVCNRIQKLKSHDALKGKDHKFLDTWRTEAQAHLT